MKHKRSAALTITVVTVAILAYAADYGRYMCVRCPTLMDPISVRGFVGIYVNPNVAMWRANDTVSICNGSMCTMYITPSAGATTWSPVGQAPDPQTGYKGTGEPVVTGPGDGEGNPIGGPGDGDPGDDGHGGSETCISCHQ